MNRDKISLIKVWLGLILGVVLITVGTILIIKMNEKEESDVHKYVSTIVVDKYINEGYGGWYHYKDTEYIIVSETDYGDIITTVVDVNVYNMLDFGDNVYYCENHNKLKIYE